VLKIQHGWILSPPHACLKLRYNRLTNTRTHF